MAKSKSGGTRTYIRGRVGSDVYSIGRDAKGKKQQVVRSLAESVANPQTQSQMKGRMIMSTIAQAMAVLRPIIDHSFDGVSGARANIAQFVSQNYNLIKNDIDAHPSTGNIFGLVSWGEKGAKQGAYKISDGQATIPAALVLTKATGVIVITMAVGNVTIGGLKSALGMTNEEYFTLVGLTTAGAAAYERFRVNPSLSDDTVISAENISNVFAVEGNAVATVALAGESISITLAEIAGDCAVIVSKKANGKYIHNEAQLGDGSSFVAPSNTALPTYPVGNENYLNGGDIFGQQESFNPGGGDTPAPTPTPSHISGVTVNGASVAQTGAVTLNQGNNAVVVGIIAGTDGESYGVAAVDAASATIGGTVAAGSQTSVLGATVNLNVNAATTDNAKKIVLCKGTSIVQVWGTLNAPASQATTPTSITGVTFGGNSVAKSGIANLQVGVNTITVNTAAGTDGKTYKLAAVNASAALVGQSVDAGVQVAITGNTTNLNVTGVADGPAKSIVLVENNLVVDYWGQFNSPASPSGDAAAIATLMVDEQSVARNASEDVETSNSYSGTVTGTTQGMDYAVGVIKGNPQVGQHVTSILSKADVNNGAFSYPSGPSDGKFCLFLMDDYDPNASGDSWEIVDIYCEFWRLDKD